jgi:hypothetical protein
MFNKSDEADCVAKKMERPTNNDGGDRVSPTIPYLFLPLFKLTPQISGGW